MFDMTVLNEAHQSIDARPLGPWSRPVLIGVMSPGHVDAWRVQKPQTAPLFGP